MKRLACQISASKLASYLATLCMPEESTDEIHLRFSLAVAFKIGNPKTLQNHPVYHVRGKFSQQK